MPSQIFSCTLFSMTWLTDIPPRFEPRVFLTGCRDVLASSRSVHAYIRAITLRTVNYGQ